MSKRPEISDQIAISIFFLGWLICMASFWIAVLWNLGGMAFGFDGYAEYFYRAWPMWAFWGVFLHFFAPWLLSIPMVIFMIVTSPLIKWRSD